MRQGRVNRVRKETPNRIHDSDRTPVSERPHRFYDDQRFPFIAEMLCTRYGMTNEEIAPVFGVSVKTIESWSYKYPAFRKACQNGRDVFDGARVEQALLKRALGYQFTETSTREIKIKGTRYMNDQEYKINVPAIETVTTIKEIPADVKAIMFWLTNRNRERWQMVTTVNANIKATTESTSKQLQVKADLSKMNSDQLKALRGMIMSQDPKEIQQDDFDMVKMIEDASSIVEGEYM